MKYYNNIKSLLCGSLLLVAGATSLTSCKDWLDKDPESIVAEDEAFKNFRNFQGYIEEIYSLIPDKQKANYCTAWNFGDDAVHNTDGSAHMDNQVDLGNYRDWYKNTQCWLNGAWYSLWNSSWYSIRKCNLGIENIKAMVGTEDEEDLILGQLYFFRAWWHFELMCYFGGLPYIDKAFDDDIPHLPRLSFRECADRCAQDFEKAAELLPEDWDTTLPGMETLGSNDLRINKTMAKCYLGKVYLWAASPLMNEMELAEKEGRPTKLLEGSAGGDDARTYKYDVAYCKKAAEVLGEILEKAGRGSLRYKLAQYNYDNIYDHERNAKSETNYSDIFYTIKQNWKHPGSTEAIFRGLPRGANTTPWNCAKLFGPKVAEIVEHDVIIHHPTANLIDQYGMANGQPIYLVENGVLVENPESGFDPEYPYKNRDPRFYHDIVFDGFHYVLQTENLDDVAKQYEYCSLYTGGGMRGVKDGSSTGYFIQKLIPHQCNKGDGWYNWDYAIQSYLPYMRLADVYLMYAEAQNVVGGPKSVASSTSLTPEGAINTLRRRVSSDEFPMADVQPNFLSNKWRFLDEVRRERAVELSFEGFRWCDLQRWLLLTEKPYTMKYSHEFQRLQDDDWFKEYDPKNAKVGNFTRKELITRRLESKHYWFPLPDEDTYLYEGFPQNPGW